jgi:hypothetical protein
MPFESEKKNIDIIAEKKGEEFDLILRKNEAGNYELFFDGLQDKGEDVVIEIEGVDEEQAKKMFDYVAKIPEGTHISMILTLAKKYKEELLKPE